LQYSGSSLFFLTDISYNKPMREKQDETDDAVKLEAVLGIKPGVYLTVLYSVILLLIFFFLFVFPGIRNPSAVLFVKTEPAGAAVRLNDVYMGVSGKGIPIRSGKYTIEVVMNGFTAESAVHEIPGRVFFSLFFPRRYYVEFTLKTRDPAAVFAQAAAEFAQWSFGGEPTLSWQIPLTLSEGAYRIGSSKNTEITEILTASSRFAVTRAGLRDLSRAKLILDNNGLSPCAPSLVGSISDILVFLSDNHGSAEWLSGLLPPESASLVKNSNWYKNETSFQSVIIPVHSGNTARRVEAAGLTFLEIPAGTMTGGKERSITGFLISENPVSRSLFETFLDENPKWKEEYTDYYMDEISVINTEIYSSDIITGISWYAAQEFCRWLSKRLPSSMTGMEARLPLEIEWEYAAMFGIKSMENPVWEWCADPFAPLSFIAASADAVETAGSPERSLRGRPSISVETTRASLPPEFSSPFVTLRPVISQKD